MLISSDVNRINFGNNLIFHIYEIFYNNNDKDKTMFKEKSY